MKIIHKIAVVTFIFNCTQSLARIDWSELNNEQQKILLPFESSWNSLEDDAKEKLMTNTNKWLDMTPLQRMESRKKLNRFKQLSKEEREIYQQRFNHLKNLTPHERKELEKAKRRFKQLSPKKREKLKNKYRQLPPEHRKKAIRQFNRKQNEKNFVRQFDSEKRRPIVEMIKNLEKADRLKFRAAMKNLSPKLRHRQVLELLELDAENRSRYIQGMNMPLK